jgi:PAP2 superfamily
MWSASQLPVSSQDTTMKKYSMSTNEGFLFFRLKCFVTTKEARASTRAVCFLSLALLLMLDPSAWAKNSANTVDAEVAVAWFDLLYDIVKAESLSPPVAARAYGIASITLYEAIVPGSRHHQSLVGQLNELSILPPPERHKSYHWPAVANSALATSLRHLFPSASAESLAAVEALAQHFAGAFKAEVPPARLARSVTQGQRVADAVFTWASADGYNDLNDCPFTPPKGPGLWVPTPPSFTPNPLQPCWGQLVPFVLSSGAACAPPPPPGYSEDSTSQFFLDAREVYETVNNLTAEQQTIAQYWADAPGMTGTPPGHWIAIVGQLAEHERLSLATAAEAYARVGIAVADAFIASWHTKYQYNLLRPVTYIRRLLDPAWSSFIATPPFPEYTSGHSVQSGAAATVLTDLFGDKAFTDTTHVDHELMPTLAPRSFTSFAEAANEAAISRLYGGIHFRPAIGEGLEQGVCVGETIIDRIQFTKARHAPPSVTAGPASLRLTEQVVLLKDDVF